MSIEQQLPELPPFGTLHGSSAPLPIKLRTDVKVAAEVVSDGTVAGVTVACLAGTYPAWEIDCAISVSQMAGRSSLDGVVIGGETDHVPPWRGGEW